MRRNFTFARGQKRSQTRVWRREQSAFQGALSSPPDYVEGRPIGNAAELERLYAALGEVVAPTNPRTFKLLSSSNRKVAQKVIDEAGEVALEAIRQRKRGVIHESADLLYHLVVLWWRAGIDPSEIWNEMRQRTVAFGLAEKRPKAVDRNGPKSPSVI